MGDSNLSLAQFILLLVVCLLSSTLSTLGSSLIICSIFRHTGKPLKQNTLHQLLLGLSLSDILSTATALLFILLTPKDGSSSNPWALGNQLTCSASAFVFTLSSTAANLYNMFMSIHFWRMVRSNKKRARPSHFTKQKDLYFRIGAHSISILVPLAFSLAGVLSNSFRELEYPNICYYEEYPYGCHKDPNIECQHGDHAALLGKIRSVTMALIALSSIAITIKLTLHVRNNLKKSAQYSPSRTLALSRQSTASTTYSIDVMATSASTHSIVSMQTHSQDKQQQQQQDCTQREIAQQALWYMLAYTNSFVFYVIAAVVVNVSDAATRPGDPGPYTLLLLLWFSTPIQGFLNFIVFIRPRYNSWKAFLDKEYQRQHSDNNAMPTHPSWTNVLKKAILQQVPSSRHSRRAGRRPNNNSNRDKSEQAPQSSLQLEESIRSFQSPSWQCSSDERSSTLKASQMVPPTILEDISTSREDVHNQEYDTENVHEDQLGDNWSIEWQ